MMDQLFGAELWSPSVQRIAASHMSRFANAVGVPLADLHHWSVTNPDDFWSAVWQYADMKGVPGDRAFAPGGSLRTDRYFPDATLNLATNLICRDGRSDAVVVYGEDGDRRALSWDELRSQVGACAAALRSDGVGPGDRVCAYLPNGIEAIVAMIATASLGAVFSTASPDFGTSGVLDRFAQIDPTVLFACTEYSYAGKRFDTSDRVAEIRAGLPSLIRVVQVNSGGFEDYLHAYRGSEVPSDEFPFDQPWYVLYSSGTTGKPKCFVHGAGNVLIQHRKEHLLHCDVSVGDVLLYFTTTGWMMWNWLVSGLASGATVVCVDGSPFHPNPARLFDIVDREGVSLLGVGAKYIDALKKEGLRPAETHDLTSLRTICSTGSPLAAEGFAYVYTAIKSDVHLASISGGTDLCSCFVGGDPTQPVFAGEIQAPGLGMKVDVWDDAGNSLIGQPGTRGELVCTHSFPSMPLRFWGDDGSTYTAAYFARFGTTDVWAHGDFAAYTHHQGFVIHGRSDATLNPGGVRIGTAEITRQVEHDPTIAESLVFGQDYEGDTRIVLLVRMMPGHTLTPESISSLKQRIRSECSPRHVPALVLSVDDLPRTRSGKLTELAVADAVNGRPVRNTEAMANPEALWSIAQLPELKQG
jgi:acetoacetyl-CoA synthetase